MHDWNLPPLRSGHPPSADLLSRRARASAGGNGQQPDETQVVGGIECLIVGDGQDGGTLLYFHGGGYRMGSPEAWLAYARALADASGLRIVLPRYRLSPEHPFPAALHDAVAVYRELAAAGPVLIAGDSAGAGLTASLCIAADRAGRRPIGAVLVSPMLDLTARDETYATHAESDTLFSRQSVLDAAALYLQGHDPCDPLVSPLEADPRAFPSLLLLTGGSEVLLGEALAFAERLARADRTVRLHVAAGMGHVWPMMMPDSTPARAAIAAIADFARAALSDFRQASGGPGYHDSGSGGTAPSSIAEISSATPISGSASK